MEPSSFSAVGLYNADSLSVSVSVCGMLANAFYTDGCAPIFMVTVKKKKRPFFRGDIHNYCTIIMIMKILSLYGTRPCQGQSTITANRTSNLLWQVRRTEWIKNSRKKSNKWEIANDPKVTWTLI